MKLRPAEPLPVVEAESVEEDDDDDFFGLGSDDDDDDDEENERPSLNSVPDASEGSNTQESDDDDDDDDILGFSALLDIFTGEDDSTTKRPKITTAAPLLEFTIPILSRPTPPALLENHELSTIPTESENNEGHENDTEEPDKDEESTGLIESNTENNIDENQEQITEASNKISYLLKPNKATTNKVKKGGVGGKKPSVTSTSVNAIHNPEKPAKKPIKDEYDEDINEDDILDDDDDDDVLDDDDDDEVLDDDDEDKSDEDEDNDDKLDDEKHTDHEDEDDDDDDEDVKAEDLAELDDDDEEEDAMLSAFMETGKSKKNKDNQTNTNEDYELDFLSRKHSEGNRQSKLTRL